MTNISEAIDTATAATGYTPKRIREDNDFTVTCYMDSSTDANSFALCVNGMTGVTASAFASWVTVTGKRA